MVYWTILLVLCCMAFPNGVLWNGYVLFVTSCRVERTASTVWFQNRAMSDFIFILCLPLRFIFIFIPDLDWARRLSSTITSLHIFSSAFLLTAISVHRCILIAWPEWAQKHHTASLAFWGSLVVWALSAGFSLRYGDLCEFLPSTASTSMHFPLDEGRAKVAVVIQFLAGFLIPLALIFILIFYVVHAARLRRNRPIQATQLSNILHGLIPTFFLGWLPYHVFYFLQLSAMHPLPLLETGSAFACVLTYINNTLNPIFYLTMEEEFLRYHECACNPETSDQTGLEPAE